MTNGFQVRPATPEDIGAVHGMILDLARHQDQAAYVKVTREGLLAACFGTEPKAAVLVAEGPHGPVGFVSYMLRYNLWSDGEVLSVDDLFVRAEGRGRGIGRALMAEIARIALDRGSVHVRWEVENANVRAVSFYRRLGATVWRKSICRWDREAMRAALAAS